MTNETLTQPHETVDLRRRVEILEKALGRQMMINAAMLQLGTYLPQELKLALKMKLVD